MIKTKSKKMREVVEHKLYLLDCQLKNLDSLDNKGTVYQTLIAQQVIVEEILKSFEKMGS